MPRKILFLFIHTFLGLRQQDANRDSKIQTELQEDFGKILTMNSDSLVCRLSVTAGMLSTIEAHRPPSERIISFPPAGKACATKTELKNLR
jgi:hypothetical protein